MPEKTKRKTENRKLAESDDEKTPSEKDKTEKDKSENLEKKSRKKSYYYDDAHGYEIYNPNEDDEKTDED